MICGIYAVLGAFLINAARNPSEHRSLIWFTIWSSIVHALILRASRAPTCTRWVTYWVMYPLSCWSLLYFGSCCHPNKRV
jgi:hypothetical protein